MLPVDEVSPGVGRRGAVGFLHREEKSERGVDITPLQGARRSEGPRFFSFFPQHLQPALGWWKMGTPATSICGLILSLILSCQLVTVSERKLSLLPSSFSAFQRSPSGECFVFHSAAKVSCNRPEAPGGQIKVTNQCFCVLLKAKNPPMCLCCYLCSVNSAVCWCRAAHIHVGPRSHSHISTQRKDAFKSNMTN